MDLNQLLGRGGGGMGGGMGMGGGAESPADNAETITISSLALLKMLKHGRAGVPLEVSPPLSIGCCSATPSLSVLLRVQVMGLMLGYVCRALTCMFVFF